MAHRVYETANEQPDLQGAAIILLNHGGSSVHEDAGRDAAYLADTLGMPVLAADRPGSGTLLPHPYLRHRLNRDYIHETSRLGRRLNQIVSSNGWDRLAVVGRSFGGFGAIALTRSEQLPVAQLYAAEPMGMVDISVEEADERYEDYSQRQNVLQRTKPGLILPLPSELSGLAATRRTYRNKAYFLTDRYHNRSLVCAAPGVAYLTEVLEKQPDTGVLIDFAEYSMAAPDSFDKRAIALMCGRLCAERQTLASSAEVFGTTHASFDNREFFASRIGLAVARLAQP